MPSFGFIPYMVSEKKIFKHFYENQPFLPPQQPIKFTDLDKSHMKRSGLLNKHFCKKKFQISPIRQKKLSISSFPIISLWELKVPPTYRCYIWNMRRIGPAASEKKSFENVDDVRRTDDGYLYILKAQLWAFGSGELISNNMLFGQFMRCFFEVVKTPSDSLSGLDRSTDCISYVYHLKLKTWLL